MADTTVLGKGPRYEIVPDDNPDNPRTEYDNLGTMLSISGLIGGELNIWTARVGKHKADIMRNSHQATLCSRLR